MVTQVGRDDEFSINRQQMVARIHVCMGGQVAEELIFGRDQVRPGRAGQGRAGQGRRAVRWPPAGRRRATLCGT
jgi:hypothetical protein